MGGMRFSRKEVSAFGLLVVLLVSFWAHGRIARERADSLFENTVEMMEFDEVPAETQKAMEDVFEPKQRPEHSDILARATVYVMNMIVIVMSLPVGLALLAFNILGGENLRTTAHVIALTGMGVALSQTPQGGHILSMF